MPRPPGEPDRSASSRGGAASTSRAPTRARADHENGGGPSKGGNQEELRRHNLSVLLSHVHFTSRCTRADLTAASGLNRSTVGALVADLAAGGLVHEGPALVRTGTGRPSLLVRPATESVQVIAILLGVDEISAARVGLGGVLLQRLTRRHDRGPHPVEAMVEVLTSVSSELVRESPLDSIVGVGVAVPGTVRRGDGLVRSAPNLGWVDVPLRARLARALSLPVVVSNDANCGAFAERLRGVAHGMDDVVFLQGGVGVGGGVIAGGRAVPGHAGYAGEFGHLPVNPQGRRCGCGRIGCWETEVGENALLQAAGRLPGGGRTAVLEVLEAAAREERAAQAVAAAAEWLGRGLGAVRNVLDPEIVILAGTLGDLYDAAGEVVLAAMAATAVVASAEPVRLSRPTLPEPCLIGAAEAAFAELLADPSAYLARRGPQPAWTPPPSGGPAGIRSAD